MRRRTSVIWTCPKEEFSRVVSRSNTIADVLRHFGLCVTGKSHKATKERIMADGLDASHISLGLNNRKGKRSFNESFPLDSVMVEHSTYDRGSLKRRLIRSGLMENKCSICEQENHWMGKPLTLVLDHINGIRDDHRLENLRFLCPNCNSQTDTFSGRNKQRNRCSVCSKQIGRRGRTGMCWACAVSKNETRRPDKETLRKMVVECPLSKIAKGFGVSGKTVEKWCKKYSIETHGRGYWAKIT